MAAAFLSVLLSALFTSGAGYPSASHAWLQGPNSRCLRRVVLSPVSLSSPRPPAAGRFLIASRRLGDPNFSQTVVLLIDYGAHGAMGVVINRPTPVTLASALPDVKELHNHNDRVFLGGPVGQSLMLLLVRSQKPPAKARRIFGDVYASGSLTVLRKTMSKKSKNHLRAFIGYAGWGPGQLKREINRGDWYVAPADAKTIFDTPPADIWRRSVVRFSGEWTRRDNTAPLAAWFRTSPLRPRRAG